MKRSRTRVTAASAFILGLAGLTMWTVLSWSGPAMRVAIANPESRPFNSTVISDRSDSLQQINSARAALTRALANRERKPAKAAEAEVLKAFAFYEAVMNARIGGIVSRLKELDARIPKAGLNQAVDSAAHRKAIAESLNKSGVKDEYLARSRELQALRNELQDLSFKVNGALANPACPPQAINNTLGGASPDFPSTTGTQTGRLTRDGSASTCEQVELKPKPAIVTTESVAALKTCPSLEDETGQRTFDQYQFFNAACGSVCVTVTLSIDTPAAAVRINSICSELFPVAYLTSFNPSDLCQNYLADPGASPASAAPVTFSFDVPSQQTLVIIVHEETAGAGTGCPYTLNISGLCQPCLIGCGEDFFAATDPNLCTATVSYPLPITCGECGMLTCSPAPGSIFLLGTTPVTCSTDAGASCTFNVSVEDQQPPTITCPANINAMTAPACPPVTSGVVTYPAPAVSDNCGEAIGAVCTPSSGSVFPVGTTTVTCTSTDTAGNTGTCSFTVSVFNGSLQDDSNPNNVLLFNTVTGAYSFCCNGTIFSGTGSVILRGCTFTLQHNPADRRVLAKVDFSVNKGTASLQSPAGTIRCTIADRDITNNTHSCP